MRFYTTLKLGPNREQTPAGFTIFRNVSIARTGEQIYGPGETDIESGDDRLVHITRTPEEVFRPETLASFNGATFTLDHPIEDVSPDNWPHLAHGTLFNARRGTDEQKDEMVGDLMVTTRYALAEIDSGKREVSAGYDADYFQTGPGQGEQRNIVGNHVALVDSGRCGPRCAVKDRAHKEKNCMKKSIKDRILDAFKAKDEEGMKKALEEVKDEESSEHHVHVHLGNEPSKDENEDDPIEKRFKAIEDGLAALKGKTSDAETEEAKKKREEEESKKAEDEATEEQLGEEAPEGEMDSARKARDSSYLVESFENVKMQAEIIAPGIRIPTFDKASDPKKTFTDCICGLRRKALQMGSNDTVTAGFIEQARGKVTDSSEFKTMPCGQIRTLFNSVAALKRVANNLTVFADGGARRTTETPKTPIERFADASEKRWGVKK